MNTCITNAAMALLGTMIPIELAKAQTIGVALSSSASNLVAIAGSSIQVMPIPAMPLRASGTIGITASAPSQLARAAFRWDQSASQSYADVTLRAQCSVSGGATSTVGQLDVMVMLSYPTQTTVRLYASTTRTTVSGSPMPTAGIDIYDDGVFETLGLPSGVSFPVVLGPIPTPVRCRLAADLPIDGNAIAEMQLSLVTGETTISPLASGCQSEFYWLQPRFDGGVEFGTVPSAADTVFAVFGLAAQPVYLGNYALPGSPVILPCMLLPTPDLVTFLSATAPSGVLQIPAAARPITIFSQAVRVVPGGLLTSDASIISAN